MRVYRLEGMWHVVKDGLLLGRGPSLEAIREVLAANWH